MHTVTGTREPADSVPGRFDDARERRDANHAVGVSAVGLAITGLVELGLPGSGQPRIPRHRRRARRRTSDRPPPTPLPP